MRTILAVVTAVVCGLAGPVSADSRPVQLDDVPAAAKFGASLAAPSVVRLRSANLVTAADGTSAYQIFGTNKAGKRVEILVAADGAIRGVFVKIDLAEVPAAARDALAAKHPGFLAKVVMAAGMTDKVADAQAYRYEGVSTDDKSQTFLVSADGKEVVTIVSGGPPAPTPVTPKPTDYDVFRPYLEPPFAGIRK